jgi:hypothetical protein
MDRTGSSGGRPSRKKSRLLLTFREVADPSHSQIERAKRALKQIPGTAVVGQIPGTFRISVEPGREPDLRRVIKSLDHWELVEEGFAEMPPTKGLKDF